MLIWTTANWPPKNVKTKTIFFRVSATAFCLKSVTLWHAVCSGISVSSCTRTAVVHMWRRERRSNAAMWLVSAAAACKHQTNAVCWRWRLNLTNLLHWLIVIWWSLAVSNLVVYYKPFATAALISDANSLHTICFHLFCPVAFTYSLLQFIH